MCVTDLLHHSESEPTIFFINRHETELKNLITQKRADLVLSFESKSIESTLKQFFTFDKDYCEIIKLFMK